MRFILAGGKDKDSNQNKIEQYALKLANKDKPIVLFIPLAVKDTIKAIDKFKKMMANLCYELLVLDFDNYNQVEELIQKSDIIYVSGGVSDDLVLFFKEKGLDKILYKYFDTDKLYVGSSAGAMLITKVSMGDKYMFSDNFHNYNYKMVDCLGFLNISICPHYQNEDLIVYNDEIKKYSIPAFGLEEDTAILIDGNKVEVLKDYSNKSVYYFDKDNHKMIPLYEGEIYENCGNFRS